MKTGILILNKTVLMLLLFYSFCDTIKAQVNNLNAQSGQIPYEIISQSLSNNVLWAESTLSFNSVSTLYVLNHGVELDLPSNLEVNGKAVTVINKDEIDALGNSPYFLFHTLNIEDSKAFVRIYLSYVLNNQRKTNNVEIYFIKNNNRWEFTNNQL